MTSRALLLLTLSWVLGDVFADEPTEFSLLFVGNSLTSAHNLPKLVEKHAASLGITVETKKLTRNNYAIVDHWAEGWVQRLVQNNHYDFVIIQQGPSSQADGHDMLVNGGAEFAQLCAEHNCQLAYLMVWPSVNRYHAFDAVINNYSAGAQANDAVLIPVGQQWKAYIDATGDLSYYSSDGFHPSSTGSQRAAEIVVNTLFRLNP